VAFCFFQNYPNPFNPTTNLCFDSFYPIFNLLLFYAKKQKPSHKDAKPQRHRKEKTLRNLLLTAP